MFIMRRGRKAREVEVRGEVEQSKGRQHELQGEGGRGDFRFESQEKDLFLVRVGEGSS